MARFPANSGQLIPLVHSNFKGYNIVDDPSTLPPGYLAQGSRDVDLTRQRGALAKRPGAEALLNVSLGAGGIKGFHNFRRSVGERLLFGHGTDCYKLTGTATAITKTDDADWNAGTPGDNLSVASGSISIQNNRIDCSCKVPFCRVLAEAKGIICGFIEGSKYCVN